MKNFVCMLLCLVGAICLTTSDAFINMSASSVLGSSEDSAFSFKTVAVGVTIALLALGSIASALKSTSAQVGVWTITLIAGVFSGVLTVQSTAIDYAANDHSGSIQHAKRKANRVKIKQYESEMSKLDRKMKECEKDKYYAPCSGTEIRIARLSDKIAAISDSSADSVRAQKVDITDAVQAKAGVPGVWIERVGIYSRAIGVPLMIAVLMFGFWTFWDKLSSDWKVAAAKRKKQLATA